MALLDRVVGETIPPESESARRKASLDQLRGAVAHHMYEEENGRLLDIRQLPAPQQLELTRRYRQEFDRYLRSDSSGEAGTQGSPAVAH